MIPRINKLLCEIIGWSAIPKWQSNKLELNIKTRSVTLLKEISIQDKLIAERRVRIISVSWIHHTDVDEVNLLAQRSTEKFFPRIVNFLDIRLDASSA